MDTKSHLTLTCRKPARVGYPSEPKTLGEHLRKRRMDLELLQRQVAERLGADTMSVNNWETGRSEPELRFLPGIIEFLGTDPRPEARSIGGKLVAYREARGWTQKRLAQELGIDPTTLSRWELGKKAPRGTYEAKVSRLLGTSDV